MIPGADVPAGYDLRFVDATKEVRLKQPRFDGHSVWNESSAGFDSRVVLIPDKD